MVFKTSIWNLEAPVKRHCTREHSDSHSRSAINRTELFCRNCSKLYRFNCISTVYTEMNFIRNVFSDRCTYLQHLVPWGFISQSMLLYRLVCETEFYCKKTSDSENFTVIILALFFRIQ